jgi:hypothetical protein
MFHTISKSSVLKQKGGKAWLKKERLKKYVSFIFGYCVAGNIEGDLNHFSKKGEWGDEPMKPPSRSRAVCSADIPTKKIENRIQMQHSSSFGKVVGGWRACDGTVAHKGPQARSWSSHRYGTSTI